MPLSETLNTLFDLATVIAGFSLIIVLHELGHFVAARWARIRTLAFALGFGPAIVSYRRGIGFRRGSSEAEYLKELRDAPHPHRAGFTNSGAAPTEYRINWIPLGGYVKMLGQEDLDPTATSSEPDSYQNAPPWKRMIVISAGVVMNIITAAILFVIVFSVGLRADAPTVGEAIDGSPAFDAVALNASELGVEAPGLAPGDVLTSVNGRKPKSFDDANVSILMTGPNEPVRLSVERPGIEGTLRFEIDPEKDPITRTLSIGVTPAYAGIVRTPDEKQLAGFMESLDTVGLSSVEPGMRLTAIGDDDALLGSSIRQSVRGAGGAPVDLTFEDASGSSTTVTITPEPVYEIGYAMLDDALTPIEHLLGLTPVMRIADGEGAVTPRATEAGLEPGDVFARIGGSEYPSLLDGIREIRARSGRKIDLVVIRVAEDGGSPRRISIEASVSADGRIGFTPDTTLDTSTLLAAPAPSLLADADPEADTFRPAALSVIEQGGVRVVSVAGVDVESFGDIRAALLDATRDAKDQSAESTRVVLTLAMPLEGAPRQEVEWTLDATQIESLHALGWAPPFSIAGVFEPERTLLKADDPLDALGLGLSETRRVMLSTYLTFVRLFQGTVKVEHLKGPVGIAHVGTLIAKRGWVWLLFFMAIISVNLAVVNFLPLPIVDGGHFIMLLYEQFARKPVPIVVQNVVTLAGLMLIGTMFLLVTFYDLRALLG